MIESRFVTASDHSELMIKYELPKENLYRLMLLLQLRKPWFYVYAAIIISFSLGLAQGMEENYPPFIAVALVAFILVVCPYLGARKIAKDPNLSAPVSVTFFESGISTKAKHANSTVEWTVIKKATERGRYIFIYLSRWNFWLIPEQQLTVPELASLKSILRQHLKNKARLSS
jgi:YcxB-like protein